MKEEHKTLDLEPKAKPFYKEQNYETTNMKLQYFELDKPYVENQQRIVGVDGLSCANLRGS